MPLPINRIPPGLLSLLDIKSSGVNPLTLGDNLIGSIDLNAAYIAGLASTRFGVTLAIATTGAQAIGGGSGFNFAVGPGQLMIADKFAIRASAALGAGVAYSFRACVYDSNLGVVVHVGPLSTGTVGDLPIAGFDGPVYVAAGYSIGMYVEDFLIGGAAFQGAGSITMLTV